MRYPIGPASSRNCPGSLSNGSQGRETSVKAQRKINEKRGQVPPRRHLCEIISRKSKQLLADCNDDVRKRLLEISPHARFLTQPSNSVPQIASGTASLVVTSPPFLN